VGVKPRSPKGRAAARGLDARPCLQHLSRPAGDKPTKNPIDRNHGIYPVPLKVYDETIRVLKSAVKKAKLGQDDELGAVRRLDEESRRLEHFAKGPSVEALISEERAHSHEYRGRSVFGWEPSPEQLDEKTGLRVG
jgi:hypothetical protein